MEGRLTHILSNPRGIRRKPSRPIPAVIGTCIALMLPAIVVAEPIRNRVGGSGVADMSGAEPSSAVSASAWQLAARHQAPWLDAMYGRTGGDAWHTLVAPRPLRRAAGPPETEPLRLHEMNAPLLEFAATLLGRPYRLGADSGAYDCSGFVRRVFAEFGIDLPHSSRQQFTLGRDVDREALRPGDLVFFRASRCGGVSHVGLYAGDGLFVHAARHAGRVRVDALDTPYFASRYAGARRLPIECGLVNEC